MQPKPDGKPARTERVTFTKDAASRIAKVVRKVEAGNRDAAPLVFDKVLAASAGSPLRLGTFTGNWEKGSQATVTLHDSTQTATVYNWCNSAVGVSTSDTTSTRYVIFGKVNGTNSAVEIQMQATGATCSMSFGGFDLTTIAEYDSDAIQVLGHNSTGPCLQWYSIIDCSAGS